MSTAALILAAGSGARLMEDTPKAFLPVRDRPLVRYSLESLAAAGVADRAVLVVADDQVERARLLLERMPETVPTEVVVGGSTRQASVRCGLAFLTVGDDVVLCHDAARPFASPELFRRVAAALRESDASGAVPIVPSPDTVKRVADGRVVETIPRDSIGLVQTPQAFDASSLRRAHDHAATSGLDATDDAMLLEAIGSSVVVVEGEATNFKVTTPDDLRRAEAFVEGWIAQQSRRETR